MYIPILYSKTKNCCNVMPLCNKINCYLNLRIYYFSSSIINQKKRLMKKRKIETIMKMWVENMKKRREER